MLLVNITLYIIRYIIMQKKKGGKRKLIPFRKQITFAVILQTLYVGRVLQN